MNKTWVLIQELCMSATSGSLSQNNLENFTSHLSYIFENELAGCTMVGTSSHVQAM